MTFEDLGINNAILKALDEKGYVTPTLIQEKAIPILLDGKDLLGCAQTGTGKTAAFAIPIIQYLQLERFKQERFQQRKIKALILSPTRELALQISNSFDAYAAYAGLKNTVVYGGVKQGPQTRALDQGVDILIATPGRLLDLIDQGFIDLSEVQHFVLDEADLMLDMGFIGDIRKVLKFLPAERQSLFFSATMPYEIISFSKEIVGDAEMVSVEPKKTTAENVKQAVYFVSKQGKEKLLLHLLEQENYFSVLVFSRTKHGADKIAGNLRANKIVAAAIHGDRSQAQRQRALDDFKSGKTHVLVATDVAARGIDVSELSLVVNYDLPNVAETYVHRIGRTGRADASGLAISFCNQEERVYLSDIEKLIKNRIPVEENHPYVQEAPVKKIPKPTKNMQKANAGGKKKNARRSSYKGSGQKSGRNSKKRR